MGAHAHRPATGANYPITEAVRMESRTITKVEFGFLEDIEGVHQSEALVVHFSDGSSMGIETGSNARNLGDRPSKPEDFHVDFRMHWAPPRSPSDRGLWRNRAR